MTLQDPSHATGTGSHKPSKRTGWLKVTLATAMLIDGSKPSLARARHRQMPVVLHAETGERMMSPTMERFVVQPTYVAVATT